MAFLLTELAKRAGARRIPRSLGLHLVGQDWRPLNVGLLLHLHRSLFEQTKVDGGRFKDSDNLVVDRSPDGMVEVRFVPV